MIDDFICLEDSSGSSFVSSESDDRLIEYLPTQCFKLTALHARDVSDQTIPDSNALATRPPAINGRHGALEQLETAGDPKLEVLSDRCSREGLSPSQDLLEQDRAESLDFEDLIEVTHEDFLEETGDSDYENHDSSTRTNDAKGETAKGRKNVSFGLVRTHKICQGVDPPSNHALTESTDCDLTENELCSIEVYETNYRSPTKTRARHRNRVDKSLQIQSLSDSATGGAENTDTLESEDVVSENQSTSYHVIQAVDDGCPRDILLAHNFDFPRFKRKSKIRFEI